MTEKQGHKGTGRQMERPKSNENRGRDQVLQERIERKTKSKSEKERVSVSVKKKKKRNVWSCLSLKSGCNYAFYRLSTAN